MEGYEYQRFQLGASPFWTPLRFPGQYYDAETDLLENWNRYYDAKVGRYLQPEPLAATDAKMAMMPAYAYAANNPLYYIDQNGLLIEVSITKDNDGLKSTKCDTGTPENALAVTCVTEFATETLSGCTEKNCGNGKKTWGFDLKLSFKVWVNYVDLAKSTRSVTDLKVGRPIPLAQHEANHISDIVAAFNQETINHAYTSEGFDSKEQCEEALESLPRLLQSYLNTIRKRTRLDRDEP